MPRTPILVLCSQHAHCHISFGHYQLQAPETTNFTGLTSILASLVIRHTDTQLEDLPPLWSPLTRQDTPVLPHVRVDGVRIGQLLASSSKLLRQVHALVGMRYRYDTNIMPVPVLHGGRSGITEVLYMFIASAGNRQSMNDLLTRTAHVYVRILKRDASEKPYRRPHTCRLPLVTDHEAIQ